jgi:hypothetical protein
MDLLLIIAMLFTRGDTYYESILTISLHLTNLPPWTPTNLIKPPTPHDLANAWELKRSLESSTSKSHNIIILPNYMKALTSLSLPKTLLFLVSINFSSD